MDFFCDFTRDNWRSLMRSVLLYFVPLAVLSFFGASTTPGFVVLLIICALISIYSAVMIPYLLWKRRLKSVTLGMGISLSQLREKPEYGESLNSSSETVAEVEDATNGIARNEPAPMRTLSAEGVARKPIWLIVPMTPLVCILYFIGFHLWVRGDFDSLDSADWAVAIWTSIGAAIVAGLVVVAIRMESKKRN